MITNTNQNTDNIQSIILYSIICLYITYKMFLLATLTYINFITIFFKLIMLIILFFYSNDSNNIIITSFKFDDLNVQDFDPKDIFREGSIWADAKLLHETNKAYVELSDWKTTLKSRACIKCSCFSRTKRESQTSRESANGLLSKEYK